MTERDIARFWSKVDKSGECWPWTAPAMNRGYGVFGLNYKTILAHRVSWEMAYGPISNGLFVCHRCDVRACVRPDHLFLGTAQDNADNMKSKRRSACGDRHGTKTRPESIRRGSENHKSKLDRDSVLKIRSVFARGGVTKAALAREYGVSRATVRDAIAGRYWSRVSGPEET